VGQRPDAGDVADRPQALAGAQVRVNRDAVAVRLDSDRLEADAVDARTPARGHEQAVAAQRAAVVELEHVVLALAPRARRVRAEDERPEGDVWVPAGDPHRAETTALRT